VAGVQGVLTDITDRKKAEEKIIYMSFHDNLTGRYNRYYLEAEIKRLYVGRQLPISIIIADVNGLKLINDTYGHVTGNEMLKCAANMMRKACRQSV